MLGATTLREQALSLYATPSFVNTGTITVGGNGVTLSARSYAVDGVATVLLNNSGTITTDAISGHAVALSAFGSLPGEQSVTLVNSGAIRANSGGVAGPVDAV